MTVATTASQAAGPESTDRIASLDGLRGVAILAVLVFHAGVIPRGFDMPPSRGDLQYAQIAGIGWAGVDLFFVLSGFLITGILLRSKDRPHYFRNFYARRALRIFPLYYLFLGAHLFLFPQVHHSPGEIAAYLGYWSNFWQAANPGLAHHDDVIGVAWSLAIEEQFYLVWPALVFWLSRRAMTGLCLFLLVASPLLRLWLLQTGTDWTVVYVATPCRLDGLAAGALVALLPRLRARWLWAAALLAAAGLAKAVHATGGPLSWGVWMQTLGYSSLAVLSAAVVALAVRPGPVAWFGSIRWLQCFGRYSYSIYLLHMWLMVGLTPLCFGKEAWLPLGTWIEHGHGYLPAVLAFTVLLCAASLGAGIVTWHLLEKHLLALRRYFP